MFKELTKILELWQKTKHEKNKQIDDALRTIQKALNETKQYIEFSDSSRVDEYKLSELWTEASIKIRHASAELAEILNNKALYWQDSVEWSREEVLDKKIDFGSIEKQINNLLSA